MTEARDQHGATEQQRTGITQNKRMNPHYETANSVKPTNRDPPLPRASVLILYLRPLRVSMKADLFAF